LKEKDFISPWYKGETVNSCNWGKGMDNITPFAKLQGFTAFLGLLAFLPNTKICSRDKLHRFKLLKNRL